MFIVDRESGYRPWPTKCSREKNKCKINRKTRDKCAYCRMVKMISKGLLNGPPGYKPKPAVVANESTSQPIEKCKICESKKWPRTLEGISICGACYVFVRYDHNEIEVCHKNCKIHYKLRPHCKYCRMKKAESLGLMPFTSTSLSDCKGKELLQSEPMESSLLKSCRMCEGLKKGNNILGLYLCLPCYRFIRLEHKQKITICYSNCKINIKHRPFCQYCRYQKAVSLGLTGVMSKSFFKCFKEPEIRIPAKQSTSQPISSCQLCQVKIDKSSIAWIDICHTCYKFTRRIFRKSINVCHKNCPIRHDLRPLCTYCRLKKAISLGLQMSKSLSDCIDLSPQSGDGQHTTAKLSTVQIPMIAQDSDQETIIAENANDGSHACRQNNNDLGHNGQIQLILSKFFPSKAYDSDDKKLSRRGFYDDLVREFRAGTRTRKNRADEQPLIAPKLTKIRLKVTPLGTTQLDSNLTGQLPSQSVELHQQQAIANPIRCILTYNYNLLKSSTDKLAEPPRMIISLTTEVALIEARISTQNNDEDDRRRSIRRPMSLIEPHEDCYESSDEDIMEIDCDA